jgi:DNA-binding MarR family transcriptional regulator
MSTAQQLTFNDTCMVRDTCVCLHLQRAARAIARRFDTAFRPFDLTNGQFSLLMSLNRPDAATMRSVASLLAMDRTTLTAALKPLERRGLVAIAVDPGDRRARHLRLTLKGRDLLTAALPVWQREHAAIDAEFGPDAPERLRADLRALS